MHVLATQLALLPIELANEDFNMSAIAKAALGIASAVKTATASRGSVERAIVLVGDSMMANTHVNSVPNAVSYNNVSGILTVTLTSHGNFTGMDVRVACTGVPTWETRDVQLTRIDANTFSVPLAPGLGTPPAANIFRIFFPTQLVEAGPYTWLSGHRPRIIQHGVNAETIEMIVQRTSRIAALPQRVVWLRAGTNVSFGGDITGANLGVAAIRSMVETLINAGKIIIISTIPPSGTTVVLGRYTQTLNQGIRKIADDLGLFLIDEYAIIVDPVSAIGGPRLGYLSDGTHFSSRGSRIIAEVGLQVICDQIFGPPFSLTPSSALDGYDAVNNPTSKNVLSNPLLTITTGGQNGSGAAISGTIATGITLYASGSWTAGSIAASVVPAATGIGNAQRISGAPTAAGDMMRITTRQNGAAVAARMVAGRKYRAVGNVRVTGVAGQSVVRSLLLLVVFTNSEGTFTRISDHNWSGTGPDQYEQMDFETVFETPEFTLPPGVTEIYQDYRLAFNGTGTTVSMEISELAIIDVT